jgi:putative membrane protein
MTGFYDFLAANYNLVRGLHIIAVIAWMAGLLYLPRLFAYHTRATPGSEMDQTFRTMELKLLTIIMNPAMITAWVFGLTLLYIRGGGGADWWRILLRPWMVTKLLGVVFQTGWHHFLATNRKAIAQGKARHSERFWRMVNELPFLAAIIMVLAVTTEFGG